jgi:RNA polymerase sigma-70 factor (ECF subfamily)
VTPELVDLARSGDRDAYERIARDAAGRLFLVASRILGDRDAADDAVQQTLVSIWRDLKSLRDATKFEAWSYRILVRNCRAENRRRRLNVSVGDLSESMVARTDDFAAVAARDELGGAFRLLTTDQRTVLVLHYQVGLPLEQIAEIVGVPYGTVGSRLHNAKRSLKAALAANERAIPQETPA